MFTRYCIIAKCDINITTIIWGFLSNYSSSKLSWVHQISGLVRPVGYSCRGARKGYNGFKNLLWVDENPAPTSFQASDVAIMKTRPVVTGVTLNNSENGNIRH